MNRFIISVFSLVLSAGAVCAQTAQVKNAAKSAFRLTVYDSAGNESGTTSGVFTTADGECVGSWSALATASRAVVTDFNGNVYPVRTIIGVNELYDVCRFRVDAKKTVAAVMPKEVSANGTKVWLVSSEGKKVKADAFDVEREENFMDRYGYYIFAYNDKGGLSGSPFVNANGEVIGLLQQSETSLETHAVDTRFAAGLTLDALAVSNPEYNKTGIRLQMPSDKKSAQLMMMFSAELGDSAKYAGYISDYISLFPNEVDGYTTSALRRSANGDYQGADEDMHTAIKKATDKAEAHAEYARVMYQKLVYNTDSTFNHWTLDKALKEAEEAVKINPEPAYRHRVAQINYSMKNFDKAYGLFASLAESTMKNSEVFFEMAQCKSQTGGKTEQIVALLDSAVAYCPKPYTTVSAPYILTRGQMYDAMKDYRKALADYNTYDTIMVGRASADFYYTRYKCEMNMKQYQPALNDIAHAAYVADDAVRPAYLAEMASLQLRVNRYEDAVRTADMCLQLNPDGTDALIIKGVSLYRLKKDKEARECMQRAKELGDTRADEYIKKFGK